MQEGWGRIPPSPHPLKYFFYLIITFDYWVEEEKILSKLLSGGVETKSKCKSAFYGRQN